MRGLKPYASQIAAATRESHPSWVRGLKHQCDEAAEELQTVAPLVGAWIETRTKDGSPLVNVRRTPRGCVD